MRCVTYLSKHSGSNCRIKDYLIRSTQLLENIGIYFLKKLFLSNCSRYCHQISSDKFNILSSFKRCVTYLSKHSGSNCRKTDYLIRSTQLLENIGIYFLKKLFLSNRSRYCHQICSDKFLILSSFKRCVTYLSKHSGSYCGLPNCRPNSSKT